MGIAHAMLSASGGQAPSTDRGGGDEKGGSPMQQESKADSYKVTVKVKTTHTEEVTITVTEANKKAACKCCTKCKR